MSVGFSSLDKMTSQIAILTPSKIPRQGASLNPFVVLEDAAGFIDFVCQVFGAEEVHEVRTAMPDGKLIHAEIVMGSVHLLLCDRLDGWPKRPGLLQLWVNDVQAVLDRGQTHGASVVTPATPFYGETTLGRTCDSWGNLWWLYAPAPGQADPVPHWDGGSDVIFRTVDEQMRSFNQTA